MQKTDFRSIANPLLSLSLSGPEFSVSFIQPYWLPPHNERACPAGGGQGWTLKCFLSVRPNSSAAAGGFPGGERRQGQRQRMMQHQLQTLLVSFCGSACADSSAACQRSEADGFTDHALVTPTPPASCTVRLMEDRGSCQEALSQGQPSPAQL